MFSARPRRLVTASLVLTAGLTLSGCATGINAQTNAIYQPAIGANLHQGDVQLYNTLLVANTDGTYTLSGGLLNTGKQAEELTSVSVAPLDGGTPATAEPDTAVDLKSNLLYTIGTRGEIIVKSSDLSDGKYANVILTFAKAGEVSIEAPIVARGNEGLYDTVASTPGGGEEKTTPAATPNGIATQGAEGAAE